MSFILDALKKSESERQRQSGPALFEVKVAPPRSRFALWGAALGALLAVNLVVVGWMLWRGGTSRAAAPQPVLGQVAAAQSGAPRATAAQNAAGSAASRAGESVAAGAGAAAPAPSAGGPPPESADAGVSPDDLAPAVEPRRQASQSLFGVIRATESGLPTYQDAAAQPGANLPDLRLDLHVYSPQPDQRFVFLNMLKLHEGDATPKGVRVERITQDGVILSYQGKEFVLLKP